MREVWTILALVIGTGFLAAGYAFGLAWLGLKPRLDPIGWAFYWKWMTVVSGMALALGFAFFLAIVRPLGQALDRVRAGENPDTEEYVPARRLAINLPRLLGLVGFLFWMVPLVSLPVSASMVAGSPDCISLFLAALVTTGIGLVHATFIAHLVEWRARRSVVPVLVPDGNVSRIEGVHPLPVAGKLLLLFFTTGLFPIFTYIMLFVSGTANLAAALYLGAWSLVLGILQIALTHASFVRPLILLHEEMTKLRKGDLSVHAPVDSGDRLGQLNEGFNKMVSGLRRAQFIQETFGRYMSRPVLKKILRGDVALGGTRGRATILISDLRGFTSFAEDLAPEHVVLFLNRYLDAMVDVLVAHGATIDKFVGDSIVAVFGMPIQQDDHAQRAVRAAVGMMDRLTVMNKERVRAGEPCLEIGIGIHSGDVVAGNIGSSKKMEYTVIGDTVNTASRIEQLTKELGARLLISEKTFKLVESRVTARRIREMSLPGKRHAVVVYEVTGYQGPPPLPSGYHPIEGSILSRLT